MIKTEVVFVEGRLLSSHSEQFKKYSKRSDWLEKVGPLKCHFCFDPVNRLQKLFALSFNYHFQNVILQLHLLLFK